MLNPQPTPKLKVNVYGYRDPGFCFGSRVSYLSQTVLDTIHTQSVIRPITLLPSRDCARFFSLVGGKLSIIFLLRPSSYAKLIQPTTQPKQPDAQPNPNSTLLILRIIIVNICRAAQEMRPSRWVSKS